jgi:hypothetical protein
MSTVFYEKSSLIDVAELCAVGWHTVGGILKVIYSKLA